MLKTKITESEYIDFGSLTPYDAWSGIASCFIVPLRESCADVIMKTPVTRRGSVTCSPVPEYYAMNKNFGTFAERVRVF